MTKSLFILIFLKITLFAQCSDSLLQKISTSLHETRHTVEALSPCKTWPYNNDLTIVLLTYPQAGTTASNLENGLLEYDVYTLVYNTQEHQIVQKLYEKGRYSSDALVLEGITIDTARYDLSKTQRAFGVSAHYVGSSRVNPMETYELSLYLPQEKNLQLVVRDYPTLYDGGAWDGMCAGEFERVTSSLALSSSAHHGLYDLKVYQKNVTITVVQKQECVENVHKSQHRTFELHFDGTHYQQQYLSISTP